MTNKEKAIIPIESIQIIMNRHLGSATDAITNVKGGNFSSVHSFNLNEQEYVIRFASAEDSYINEPFIANLLSLQNVPYPKVFGIGREEGFDYCISERVRGIRFADLQPEQKVAVLPDLVKTMTNMNQVELGLLIGYGSLDSKYNGLHHSWDSYIKASFGEDHKGAFWENWYSLFSTSCLERDVFNECYARLLAFSKYNEPHRHFVHHDCHEWNILSDGQSITGIMDSNCIYGDFLIDVATIETAIPGKDVAEAFQLHYEEIGKEIINFKERLIGARYYKGLDGLRFFAKMGWDHAYRELRDKLLSLTK